MVLTELYCSIPSLLINVFFSSEIFVFVIDTMHPSPPTERRQAPGLIWHLIGCCAGVCFSVGTLGNVGGLVSMLWALIGHGEAN